LRLGPVQTAPATARGSATEFLLSCGLAELAEAAQLVVSELVTNAMLASRALINEHRPVPPPVGFSISVSADWVLVEVWDCSDAPPVITAPDEFSENSRGLLLVEAYANRWGWYPAQRGKRVWAVIAKSRQ
jgi:anti-sigma regulatory factor (Ser/Thr protein kinase)